MHQLWTIIYRYINYRMHKKPNFLRQFLRKLWAWKQGGNEKAEDKKSMSTRPHLCWGSTGAPSVCNTNGTIVPCLSLDDWRPKDGWPKGLPPRMVGLKPACFGPQKHGIFFSRFLRFREDDLKMMLFIMWKTPGEFFLKPLHQGFRSRSLGWVHTEPLEWPWRMVINPSIGIYIYIYTYYRYMYIHIYVYTCIHI